MVWADVLEILLNVLEASALVISVTTFFVLMLNKFSHGLKVIFSQCGLGFLNRFRILFICRKSSIKKRAFIEYAILKTQGYAVISSEWKSIINSFKGFYSENKNELCYFIPNCKLLIGDQLHQIIGRYFAFISDNKVKKALGIRDDELKWVTRIHIEEAYATPTCLLTGLLSKYEESWEDFIKKYVSTAYISEAETNTTTGILPRELYFTFAWLLWGPSCEIEYKNYWAGLCQLSYGDESNSIPVFTNRETDVIDSLRVKFESNEATRYGALLSADLSIYEKKAYMREIREFENPDNVYFYDKIKDGEATFAVQMDSFSPCVNYKSKKYYCTAYVWLLFEIEDSSSIEFHPERTVAFFEHANLADKETYSFLVETLIEKSVKHFEEIFSNKEYEKRRYRFVAAFNRTIEKAFRNRYNQIIDSGSELGKRLKKGVILNAKRKPSMAFSAFDEYFTQFKQYEFVEVSLDNNSSIVDLGKFYTSVYMECFPDSDERESFDNLLGYLKQAQGQDEYTYHILLLKDKDKIIGGTVFDYFKRTNSAVIEFLAVKQDSQSSGLGTLIFKKVQLMLSFQSNKFRKKNIDNIFCEIEDPTHSTASVKKYLYFWKKNNFKHIDFKYIQPALSSVQNPVRGLWLAVLTENIEQSIDTRLLNEVIYDYLKYCMHIDDPMQSSEYLEMMRDIEGREKVNITSII